MLVAAVLLWRHRHRLSIREVPQPQGKTSWLLGATITVVELPTAFPYFAAIAAIVGSGVSPINQLLLLILFNVCFVLPLVAIVATLVFAGERSQQWLSAGREYLHRHWPTL